MKEISKIKSHFTKGNKGGNVFGWYSHYGNMTPEELEELKGYCETKGFNGYVELNTSVQRPQRTWGSLPDWFKQIGGGEDHSHTFIFVIYDNDHISTEDISKFEGLNPQLKKLN